MFVIVYQSSYEHASPKNVDVFGPYVTQIEAAEDAAAYLKSVHAVDDIDPIDFRINKNHYSDGEGNILIIRQINRFGSVGEGIDKIGKMITEDPDVNES